MANSLYKDTPTRHRVLIGNRRRVVYARHDWEGTFIRYVVHKTPVEMESAGKSYLPAKVGIRPWFQVWEHNFAV